MPKGARDIRIDWLRGFAMVCVIVDHSKRTSFLSWFSYQRFWVVTAAEVFVVLSGIVLGTVYGARLLRDGPMAVTRRLLRRASVLYLAFIAVTMSILGLALGGVDVSAVTTWDPVAINWFLDPRTMTPHDWADVLTLRYGSWAFEIIALYVWLVIVAVPCMLVLYRVGWRPLLAVSWGVYLWYRFAPQQVTPGEFETTFPILAWQLLFVHGIVIGYYRERIGAVVTRCPNGLRIGIGVACVAFMGFALSNPMGQGPAWLHWRLVSPQSFADVYSNYFSLSDLGIGRHSESRGRVAGRLYAARVASHSVPDQSAAVAVRDPRAQFVSGIRAARLRAVWFWLSCRTAISCGLILSCKFYLSV